jgi:hypothetical protein
LFAARGRSITTSLSGVDEIIKMKNKKDERQGGPITASVNMWALLADNDPGDNPLVKRDTTTAVLDDVEVVQHSVVAVEATTTVPDDLQKSKRKKTTKKHTKERKAAASESGEAEDARRGSSCVRVLVTTAVTALVAFIAHVSASAASSV